MTAEFDDIGVMLRRDLERIVQIRTVNDYVRVTTHCMYPSNGLVTVAVRPGRHTAIVSDEGGALGEALSAGVMKRPSDKVLGRMIAEQGLTLTNGAITSPPVAHEAIAVAVLLVANASRHLAEWLYANAKIKPAKDFGKALVAVLENAFSDKLRHGENISGQYKTHKFANVVQLDAYRRLIVDSVQNEASSIYARVVSHLDVKHAEDPNLLQRIVYDDSEDWGPDDLALLSMAEVPAIPFSRTTEALLKIAAHS